MSTLLSYLDIFWVQCILLFFVSFLCDWCYTFYIRRAGEGKALPAAVWSALIVIFGSVNVISYTKNHWLLIPMVAGYFLGTYLAVKHDHDDVPDTIQFSEPD